MKIEKTKDNWEGRQSERIHEYLDQNVSIVDLNTGPTEFSEVWCGIIGRNNRYSQREVMESVLGYYYSKTKRGGL